MRNLGQEWETIPPNEQKNTRMSELGYPSNLLAPGQTYESVNETIGSIVLRNRQPATWWIGFVIAFGLLITFGFAGAFDSGGSISDSDYTY